VDTTTQSCLIEILIDTQSWFEALTSKHKARLSTIELTVHPCGGSAAPATHPPEQISPKTAHNTPLDTGAHAAMDDGALAKQPPIIDITDNEANMQGSPTP
jgi:hypothetical protein